MKLPGAIVTQIKEEMPRLLRAFGLQVETTHPNWSKAHSLGDEHRAIEDFLERVNEIVNLGSNPKQDRTSLVSIPGVGLHTGTFVDRNGTLVLGLGLPEGVDAAQETPGGRPETPRDREESADSRSDLTPLNIPESVRSEPAPGRKFLQGQSLVHPQGSNALPEGGESEVHGDRSVGLPTDGVQQLKSGIL